MPIFIKGATSVLFVHIPKTGGSSMEVLFHRSGYQISLRDGLVGKYTPNWYSVCSPQHMHGDLLRQILRLDRFTATFMIVREPVARFRSEYAMRNATHLKTDQESVESWGGDVLRRYADDPYVFDNHLRPQSDFYLPGCIVYRLEDGLDSAVADLNAKFGLGLSGELPRSIDRQEDSGISSKEVEISPRFQERLVRFYQSDFSMFDYRVDD